MRFDDFALAMETDDIWRTTESAEHQNDATIFFDVRDRFDTAAGQVEINRLRSDESFCQKVEYIRHNPVRAGIVSEPEDWPYVYLHDDQLFADQG
jgi:hypothetical protein